MPASEPGPVPDAAAGHRVAAEYLRLLSTATRPTTRAPSPDAPHEGGTAGVEAAAELLAGVTDVRAMAFVGAAFTALSRSGARRLSPAQRAQATGRHMRITAQRDAARRDPEALRGWLLAVAGEAALVQHMLHLAEVRTPG